MHCVAFPFSPIHHADPEEVLLSLTLSVPEPGADSRDRSFRLGMSILGIWALGEGFLVRPRYVVGYIIL